MIPLHPLFIHNFSDSKMGHASLEKFADPVKILNLYRTYCAYANPQSEYYIDTIRHTYETPDIPSDDGIYPAVRNLEALMCSADYSHITDHYRKHYHIVKTITPITEFSIPSKYLPISQITPTIFASQYPKRIALLTEKKIHTVISLLETSPDYLLNHDSVELYPGLFHNSDEFESYNIRWNDGRSLNINELYNIIAKLEEEFNRKDRGLTLVHCLAGVGRTGTFLCCWNLFLKGALFGVNGAVESICYVRSTRHPFAVQNGEQLQMVFEFEALMRNK